MGPASPLSSDDIGGPNHAPAPRLLVRTLGGFAVQAPDGTATKVPAGLPGHAVRYVIAAGGRVHVEELMEALWPAAGLAESRKGVRNILSRLSQAELALLSRDGEALRIADEVWVDAFAFRTLADQAVTRTSGDDPTTVARRALALYRGPFLPDDRYSDWSVPAREQIRRRYVALLDLLAHDARQRGAGPEAIQLLELAVESDPTDEIRYLELAEMLLSLGRRGRAAELIDHSRIVLRDHGLLPGATWARLQRELQQTRRATAKAVEATLHDPSRHDSTIGETTLDETA